MITDYKTVLSRRKRFTNQLTKGSKCRFNTALHILFLLIFGSLKLTAQINQSPSVADTIRHIDSIYIAADNPFFSVFDEQLPIEYQHKNVLLTFEVEPSDSIRIQEAIFVVELHQNNQLIYWNGTNLADSMDIIRSSMHLPRSYTDKAHFKAYIWNKGGETFNLKNLKIVFSETHLPDFMPEIQIPNILGKPEMLWQNHFFELVFYPESDAFVVHDARGRLLAGPLIWHSETTTDEVPQQVAGHQWKRIKVKKSEQGAEIRLRTKQLNQRMRLQIRAEANSGKLEFIVQNKFLEHTNVHRSSLIFPFADSVQEVYRKNALLDTSRFQPSYHLAGNGFKAGKDKRSFVVYHNPELSSLQLNTTNQIAVFNLDYEADHPFIHYPLLEDSNDYYLDKSATFRQKRESSKYAFQLQIGISTKHIPRLMPLPNGFEAGIIWTEHADWTDIRSQRAISFGHEDITHAENAVGGFAKWDIPVTKSVFFDNPDNISNNEISKGLFPGKHATIQKDTLFFDLLQQLHKLGFEICLHTPEQYTSNKSDMQKALSFMQEHFDSKSWIDHGYNNKLINNRENIVCDGFLKDSEWYGKDLWKQHGITYFWNAAIEEFRPFDKWDFDGQLIIPFPGYGDAFPDNIIQLHPNHQDIWMWSTSGTLEVPTEDLWDYYFHPQRLEQLIRFRSVWINHVYPAWVVEQKGYWKWDEDGKIQSMSGLDKSLERISEYRSEGKINVFTLKDYLNYFTALQQLQFEFEEDGSLAIQNGGTDIYGLSFIIKGKIPLVDGKIPPSKPLDNQTVFWFDLPANHKAILRF